MTYDIQSGLMIYIIYICGQSPLHVWSTRFRESILFRLAIARYDAVLTIVRDKVMSASVSYTRMSTIYHILSIIYYTLTNDACTYISMSLFIVMVYVIIVMTLALIYTILRCCHITLVHSACSMRCHSVLAQLVLTYYYYDAYIFIPMLLRFVRTFE